tara:strand:+ start:453 stop:584 length:132 start_codon:yes stop_codon:yes gene_type:complete
MIKKITLFLILIFMVFSCGKKGDPIYKNSKKNVEMQNILINKA